MMTQMLYLAGGRFYSFITKNMVIKELAMDVEACNQK
jgi:hypothetical protein